MQWIYAQTNRGFIALTSVLIMCAILIVLMFTVSTSSFYARFDALSSENKRASLALAESCVHVALLALATSTNPNAYSPANQEVIVGTDVHGNTTKCTIQSIAHSGQTVTIDTQASFNGAYSNVTARATVPDPSVGTLVPPPTCALSSSPAVVPSGQNVLIQWGTANSDTFTLDHAVGSVTPVGTGSQTVTTTGQGSVTYVGIVTGPGGSSSCETTFTVAPPPPAPSCADTVIMMDRTGSMTATDMLNERTASNLLVDLYKGVTSMPKIGAGSFPDYNNSGFASIPVSPYGQLQINTPVPADYDTLKSAINTMTANSNCTGSFCGTNIHAAIMAGFQELNSIRSTKPKKVLILVSDGEANRTDKVPSVNASDDALSAADTAKINGIDIYTVRYSQNTNAAATKLLAQIASGNTAVPGHLAGANDNSLATTPSPYAFPGGVHGPVVWTNASNAQADDGLVTTSSTNGQQQRYSSFAFGITSGSTISAVEATVNGYSGAGPTNYPDRSAGAVGNYDLWSFNGGGSKQGAVTWPANGDTSYITPSAVNQSQTFTFANANVPSDATINSVTITASARNSGGTASMTFRAEKGFGVADISDVGPTSGTLGTGYTNLSRTMLINPLTGLPWTSAEVNNWTTKFGVVRTNPTGGTIRVSGLVVVVNYTPASGGNCNVTVDLSWNGGTSWTSGKQVTLTGTQASTPLTGVWGGGHTWVSGDFSSTNFVARVTNNSCSGGTGASLNFLKVQVTYAGYDPTAENNDNDNYFITPAANLASIQTIFDTIGRAVCPAAAAQCGNGVDDDGDGLIDMNDPNCSALTDNDEYAHPAAPPPPVAPPPPPPINLGSWEEIPQ